MTSKKTGSRTAAKKPPTASRGLKTVQDEAEGSQDVQPKKTRRKASSKVTARWLPIRKEYVEGIPVEGSKDEVRLPTTKELAEKYGLSHHTVRERAAKERWTAARQDYQLQVAKERQRARAKTLAKQAVEFDERAYNAANLGLSIVQVRLAEIMQEIGVRKPIRDLALEAMREGQPYDKTDLYTAAYHKELEGLASALDRFQSIAMKALGTDVQKVELSGADGGPVVQNQINIHAELVRDDVERAAAVIGALADSGQLPMELIEALAEAEGEDIVDAEIVEDEPKQIEGGS